MQKNTERFFEEGNGIKANPLLKTLRTTRPILLLSVIIWLVLLLFISLAFIWASHPFIPLVFPCRSPAGRSHRAWHYGVVWREGGYGDVGRGASPGNV